MQKACKRDVRCIGVWCLWRRWKMSEYCCLILEERVAFLQAEVVRLRDVVERKKLLSVHSSGFTATLPPHPHYHNDFNFFL